MSARQEDGGAAVVLAGGEAEISLQFLLTEFLLIVTELGKG